MAIVINAAEAEILEDREHALLWDLLIHQEKGFSSRTNFFLVAQALLVLAYGVVVSFAASRAGVFAICGLALSVLWLALQFKAFSDLSKLSTRLKSIATSEHYLAWRRECQNFLVSHEIMAVVLPALCLAGWFFVLAFTS